jgi:hypothetical protein
MAQSSFSFSLLFETETDDWLAFEPLPLPLPLLLAAGAVGANLPCR